ncbi:hypothetical protein Sgly_0908 [Syntrophobotulus glycolicus DSM 8271]|uniref:Uncharacterized protein n=1 Tax=Syntrophobotulus glycolicus (strain DSM 8271 / FlGlyR) TaxID=645991 RepID=F0T1Y9_SYNGF|nr:hypothetical protein Sgly_0908 [Syntrophobotulus glycolicus DSM 8271]
MKLCKGCEPNSVDGPKWTLVSILTDARPSSTEAAEGERNEKECFGRESNLPQNTKWRIFKDKVIAAYAAQRDLRVFNQQSVFTIHNSIKILEKIHEEIGQANQFHHQRPLKQMIIPAAKSVRSELNSSLPFLPFPFSSLLILLFRDSIPACSVFWAVLFSGSIIVAKTGQIGVR